MQNNQEDYNLESAQYQKNAPKQLDKSQKIAVLVLAFFAVLVVIVWFVQAKRNLAGSSSSKNNTAIESPTCSDGNCDSSNTNLRLKDTDKDGLNDYDELNLYGTSPYLEDSDSDGYSDKQEVESNNDPSCPFGQQCNVPAKQSVKIEDDQILPAIAPEAPKEVDYSETVNASQEILNGNGDVDSLRAVLLQSGMDEKVLEQISDEELMQSYQDILGS